MKASKRLALHLAAVAAKGVVPGIPVLLLIGLIGAGAWVVTSNIQGSRADWSVIGALWCTLLFIFAIVGLLAGYWLFRLVFVSRSWGRYVPDMNDWTVAYASTVPLGVLLFLIFQVGSVPVWLYALGAVAVVLGEVSFLDAQQVDRRWKKRKAGRRG